MNARIRIPLRTISTRVFPACVISRCFCSLYAALVLGAGACDLQYLLQSKLLPLWWSAQNEIAASAQNEIAASPCPLSAPDGAGVEASFWLCRPRPSRPSAAPTASQSDLLNVAPWSMSGV
jgi:hypothetical protein